ncbi:hypothetical protein [Microlunatus sp. Gsoil 973]|uniref:hypothetical protein n=1 Tax=Microlunatus sp. Gsoil 973 TaxID=2672569 RepID=UPI0012B47640|nr:hypothetical protein [Microlunatus sp. Gsoil 973]QGN33698.1 hypothetical protein GJV80_13755 [Microlunatus sp. Gsoil 973]
MFSTHSAGSTNGPHDTVTGSRPLIADRSRPLATSHSTAPSLPATWTIAEDEATSLRHRTSSTIGPSSPSPSLSSEPTASTVMINCPNARASSGSSSRTARSAGSARAVPGRPPISQPKRSSASLVISRSWSAPCSGPTITVTRSGRPNRPASISSLAVRAAGWPR